MRIRTEIILSISFAFIVIISYLLSNMAISHIRADIRKYTDALARSITEMLISGSPQLDTLMNYIEFPIILTDDRGRIRYVRGYPPRPEVIEGKLRELEEKGNFIDIYYQDFYIGRMYFGEPRSITYLTYLPLALLVIVLLTFVLAFFSIRGAVRYESERFWNIFAKGLAHQLGNPVTSINAYLEKLRRRCPDADDVLERISEDMERVNSILRRFSKIGSSPSMREVDLRGAVERAIKFLRVRLRDRFHVKVEGSCRVRGDEELLVWVFENFIKNAFEARMGDDGEMVIGMRERDGKCIVDIIDYGRGIPEDVKRHLFVESRTTKEGGWGIGLILVERILRMHDAKVYLIDSKEGYTHFIIEFPIAH